MFVSRDLPALDQIAFFDFEASGLQDDSFPIEAGWAFPIGDIDVESLLIRPTSYWTLDKWDEEAAAVHAIRYETLVADGEDVGVVAQRMNKALRGKVVYSDCVSQDEGWLRKLYFAAGIRPEFALTFGDPWVEAAQNLQSDDDPHPALANACGLATSVWVKNHRAGPDARWMAAVYRLLVDPGFILPPLR